MRDIWAARKGEGWKLGRQGGICGLTANPCSSLITRLVTQSIICKPRALEITNEAYLKVLVLRRQGLDRLEPLTVTADLPRLTGRTALSP